MKTNLFAFALSIISSCVFAQTCQNSIIQTTPDQRYTDNGDNTVTDITTNLMWKRCSEGHSGDDCSSSYFYSISFNWQDSLQRVETMNANGGFAGYNDWRLPNIKELLSLVEEQCRSPAINQTMFGSVGNLHWTSSPTSDYPSDVWVVNLSDGLMTPKSRASNYYRVRFVRGGQ